MAQFFTDFSGSTPENIIGFNKLLFTTQKVFPQPNSFLFCQFGTAYTGVMLYLKDQYPSNVNIVVRAVNRGPAATTPSFANSGLDILTRIPTLPVSGLSDPLFSATSGAFGHLSNNSYIRQYLNGGSSVNSTGTVSANPFTTVSALKDIYYRADFNGTTVSVKNWLVGSAEPGSYPHSATVAHQGIGYVGFRVVDYLALYEFTGFGIGTDGDLAPLVPTPRVVSGTVAGNLERDVYVYAFETGVLLGKTRSDVAGAFSFNVNNDFIDKVRVVCVDEGVTPKNSLIYDRVELI